MARLAIVVMISNSDAHVVAAYVMRHGRPDHKHVSWQTSFRECRSSRSFLQDKVIVTNLCHFGHVLVNRQTWELQVFRDINNSLCGTNNARTDFFRNTAGESLDSKPFCKVIFSVTDSLCIYHRWFLRFKKKLLCNCYVTQSQLLRSRSHEILLFFMFILRSLILYKP